MFVADIDIANNDISSEYRVQGVAMAKILVVEDDKELSSVIHDYLRAENYTVDVIGDGSEAEHLLRQFTYDLIIMDWELPNLAGVELCRRFRAAGGTTPLVMLTGRQTIPDRINGLDAGADDYLTKPFDMGELSARVRAHLRRPPQTVSKILTARHIEITPETFTVRANGQEVHLVPKEFALLEFLMKHPGQVFSAEALINRIWPSDSESSPDAIKTHINRLRKKLDVPGEKSLFRTVHGMGYKLDV